MMRGGLVVSEGENVMSSSKFDKIVQILWDHLNCTDDRFMSLMKIKIL